MQEGLGPTRTIHVQLLGHTLELQGPVDSEALERAVARAESTFRAMEEACRLHWDHPPAALDTTSWLLLGVLNQAHQLACLEHEADRHTQNLELTLSKLLDDVPDDLPSASGPLFQGAD